MLLYAKDVYDEYDAKYHFLFGSDKPAREINAYFENVVKNLPYAEAFRLCVHTSLYRRYHIKVCDTDDKLEREIGIPNCIGGAYKILGMLGRVNDTGLTPYQMIGIDPID